MLLKRGIEAKSKRRWILLVEKLLTPILLHNPMSKHLSMPPQVVSRSSTGSNSASSGTAFVAHGFNFTGQCTS
ncbi:unnamed protein product [Camellia sinensis]